MERTKRPLFLFIGVSAWLVLSTLVYSLSSATGMACHQPSRLGRRVDVNGLYLPESVTPGPDGNYYVSNFGQERVDGDGSIAVISGNPFEGSATVTTLTTDMNNPAGAAFVGEMLYVNDTNMVWKVPISGEQAGEKIVFLAPEAFPTRARGLNDLTADAAGNLYMSDSLRRLIYKATPDGEVTIIARMTTDLPWRGPNGVLLDSKGVYTEQAGGLLVVDFSTGILFGLNPDGVTSTEIGRGFGQSDGLCFDAEDNLYISDYGGGRIIQLKPDQTSEVFVEGLTTPADQSIDRDKGWMIIPNFDISTVTFIEML